MKPTTTTTSKRTHARPGEPPRKNGHGIVDHETAMWWSTELREWWRRMWKPEAQRVEPHDVIATLNEAEVDFVLMGTHAMAGWFEQPWATLDVDVLIKGRHHRRAIKAICDSYPQLQMNDTAVVTRITDPKTDQVVLDLMKPKENIHREVFKHTIAVGQTHRIPDLEMALATKFAAKVSPNRVHIRKMQDVTDFGTIAVHHQNRIDRLKLERFGELVYPGGGKEIIVILNNMIEGKPIRL